MSRCTCRPCVYRRITRSANRSNAATVVIDTMKGFLLVAVPFVGFFLWASHAHPEWFG